MGQEPTTTSVSTPERVAPRFSGFNITGLSDSMDNTPPPAPTTDLTSKGSVDIQNLNTNLEILANEVATINNMLQMQAMA